MSFLQSTGFKSQQLCRGKQVRLKQLLPLIVMLKKTFMLKGNNYIKSEEKREYSSAWYLGCNIFLDTLSDCIFEHSYIVALKKSWAHLGTRGHFLGICHVLTRPQWAVLLDGPLLSGQFTAKCPRTKGAAYYNFF